MSFRFCLGASGAGKSTYLHRETVRRAGDALARLDLHENYMILVPDQFTMQTQKDLVLAAGEYRKSGAASAPSTGAPSPGASAAGGEAASSQPSQAGGEKCAGRAERHADDPAGRGGIMNIDVLSFGRLSHRIFSEIGADASGVLDDMGKSLILRRITSACRKHLEVLGRRADRPGMIAEVKSVISEFMQYGIPADGVGDLADYAASHGQGSLSAKLRDLQLLYRAFLKERENRFMTGEEAMDLLAEAIPKSQIIPHSTVVFDGFTGFTPVQYRAVLALMQCAKEVIFALDWAEDGGTPIEEVMTGAPYEEQDLFCLTRQTVSQICRMGQQGGVEHAADIYVTGGAACFRAAEAASGEGTHVSARRAGGEGMTVSGLPAGAASAPGSDIPPRFAGNPAMAHLERSLFRSPVREYALSGDRITQTPGPGAGSPSGARSQGGDVPKALPIHLILATNPGQEVRQMFIRIRRLIAKEGYHYRDLAVVAGDLSSYEDDIRVYAERYDVPVYIDTRRAVLQNPLTEAIRSALEIAGGDYSYETVFRFLRCGLSGLSPDEVDRLENYCIARGIRSRKRWESAFESDVEPMRRRFLDDIRPLQAPAHDPAASGNAAPAPGKQRDAAAARRQDRSVPERTRALYRFLLEIRAGEQMNDMAASLRSEGQEAKAMEYEQIYPQVIHLLDELYELPGTEPVSAKDFRELVETGIAEIRIGTLPQQVDRVAVGDIQRTRLPEVKVLFFLGVNDGNIPKGTSKGGLLSDLDREFLQQADVLRDMGASLAPTPREQMYIQRLYLYMNMTRPSRELYVSYAATAADGGSIRPSYLIGLLQQMYPQMVTELPEEAPVSEQMVAPKDAAGVLAAALRDYADGLYLKDPKGRDEVLTLYGFCASLPVETRGFEVSSCGEGAFGNGESLSGNDPIERGERYCAAGWAGIRGRYGSWARMLRDAAFRRYRAVPIPKKTARQIYGNAVRGSVTRLEMAAQCYLRQFLRYGLRLEEREEYTFEANDSGTILHESIQRFGELLAREGISWLSFDEEQGRFLAARSLRDTASGYNDQVLYDTARSTYQADRLQRILERTVDTLQFQLAQGDFLPYVQEQDFGQDGEVSFALQGGGRLTLQGRIDRVDLSRDTPEGGASSRIYVKIVDYKSGNKDLDPEQVRSGLQLQLVLYMMAETERLRGENPGTEVVPAGMLYYHFDDPLLKKEDAQAVLKEQDSGGAMDEAAAGAAAGRSASDVQEMLVRRHLRPKGLVGAEDEILLRLDRTLAEDGAESLAVPVKRNKGGALAKASRVYTAQEYQELTEMVTEKVCELASGILAGRTDASPVRMGTDRTACTYCPYRNACGFDPRIPGYEYRKI